MLLLLRTLAPCVLLAIVAQHVRAQRIGPSVGSRGKFVNPTYSMGCTWRAREVGSTVQLSVMCENPEARIIGGVTDLQCNYNGKPQNCEGFLSDPRGLWRQVGRAFRRLKGKVCSDERALVRAGMCKTAPRDAHFKLDITSSVVSAQSGGDDWTTTTRSTTLSTTSRSGATRSTTTTTAQRETTTTTTHAGPTTCITNHQKAEAYCSSSWVSLCNFFLSMVQSDDC